jgi:hypothetical protein
MAKRSINKSQAIREALQAHPDKSPTEIAEVLKTKGLKISAQYVSTIKSGMRAKQGRGHKVVRRRKPGRASSNGFAPIEAAVQFITAAGGIEQAKQALSTIEQIHEEIS